MAVDKEFAQKLKRAMYEINRSINDSETDSERFANIEDLNHLFLVWEYENPEFMVPESIYRKMEEETPKYDLLALKTFVRNYKRMYKTNKELVKLGGHIPEKFWEIPDQYIEYVSYAESMDMARGFFSHFDKDIFKFFEELNKDHFIRTHQALEDSPYDGETINVRRLPRPIIYGLDKGNIETALTIVHETIHSYLGQDDKDITYEEYIKAIINNLNEVYPMFTELAFIRYLHDEGFNSDDVRTALHNQAFNLTVNLEDLDENLQRSSLGKLIDDPSAFEMFCANEAYAYGGVLAFDYYDKYLDDPRGAKEDLLRLNHLRKIQDKDYLLDHSGITRKEMLKPKTLVKYMGDYH